MHSERRSCPIVASLQIDFRHRWLPSQLYISHSMFSYTRLIRMLCVIGVRAYAPSTPVVYIRLFCISSLSPRYIRHEPAQWQSTKNAQECGGETV